MNYFEWFAMAVRFRFDENALRSAFLRKSKQLHPDFHTTASDEAQALVLEQATYNNEAYKVLLNPDLRLQYILHLKGLLGDETKLALPQSFLMEMMDINEALMDLEMAHDATLFSTISADLDQQEKTLYLTVNELFDCDNADNLSAEDWQKIKIFFLKRKYLLRIREKLLTFAAQ